MASANDLRRGQAIDYNGDVCVVLDVQHRTPGNLRAFVQATLRSIKTGKSSDVRFSSTEKIEVIPMIPESEKKQFREMLEQKYVKNAVAVYEGKLEDPTKMRAEEASIPTFSQQTGISSDRAFTWPYAVVQDIAKTCPNVRVRNCLLEHSLVAQYERGLSNRSPMEVRCLRICRSSESFEVCGDGRCQLGRARVGTGQHPQ